MKLARPAGGFLAIVAAPLAAETQQPSEASRGGHRGPTVAPPGAPLFESFLQGLSDPGRVGGRNIAIEPLAAELR